MIKREVGTISSLSKRLNALNPEEGLVNAIDNVVPKLEEQINSKTRARDDFER